MSNNSTEIKKGLEKFRKKIDQIDLKILQLLEDRMEIVKEVGQFKSNKKDKFFIKSAREFDMVNDLIKKSSKNLFNSTIKSIWRKIITNANLLEHKVNIALHNPSKEGKYIYCLKDYFNDLVPIDNSENASNIILSLEQNKHQIAAFILPENPDQFKDNAWWIHFASISNNDIKIYARISTIINNIEYQLLLAAKKDHEKSKNNATISVIEFNKEITHNQIIKKFKSLDIDINILDKSNLSQVKDVNFYLIAMQGFFDMDDPKIKKLISCNLKPFIRIIGYYPI